MLHASPDHCCLPAQPLSSALGFWEMLGGGGQEPLVSMATTLLHHYSVAAVVKTVFGQGVQGANGD